jgi:hypothetical protein
MTNEHLGQLALRRLRAGEVQGDEARAVERHAEDCAECQTRLQALQAEDATFRADISFERFAAGVTHASHRTEQKSRGWVAPVMGMAAAAMVTLLVSQPLTAKHNGLKGTGPGVANVVLRIAGPLGGPQRLATPNALEPLTPGERVRIGYKPGTHRFVAAVSVDESGGVTPLYPEFGDSIPADEGEATYYLPDSIEFTGKGREAVVVVLSDQPLHVADLTRAAHLSYDDAHGDLSRLKMAVPGEQFVRVFLKP